jgi:putative hydrolase of the HAD superfamily
LPAGSIEAAAFGDGSTLREAITGRITDEQWRADVVGRLSATCGRAAPVVVAEWSSAAGVVDAEVLAVVRSARKAGWRVGLLTNATTRLGADLSRLGLDGEFDVVLNSCELGVGKPAPAAFKAACRQLAVEPRRCVFVDDVVANVAAAAEVGMDAHVYRDAQSLADILGLTAFEPSM